MEMQSLLSDVGFLFSATPNVIAIAVLQYYCHIVIIIDNR